VVCLAEVPLVDPPDSPAPDEAHPPSVEVEGRFDGSTLTVRTMRPTKPEPSGVPVAGPPCHPPAGGWQKVTNVRYLAALADYEHAHPDAVVIERASRPAPGVSVPVLAADPARVAEVERAATEAYGHPLCVVPSRYTAGQVHATLSKLQRLFTTDKLPGVYSVGLTVTDDGQAQVEVEAVMDSPRLRETIATTPKGLVDVKEWIK
jgi:hypothetical protein